MVLFNPERGNKGDHNLFKWHQSEIASVRIARLEFELANYDLVSPTTMGTTDNM